MYLCVYRCIVYSTTYLHASSLTDGAKRACTALDDNIGVTLAYICIYVINVYLMLLRVH